MSVGSPRDGLLDAWIFRHPIEVLGRSLPALEEPADPEEIGALTRRYRRTARRGVLAVRARTVLLFLFYFAAVATVVGGVGGVLGRFAFLDDAYRFAFAASAGFSLLFGAAAAVLRRYIGVLQNRLLVLGVRIHGARVAGADA